MAQLGQPPGAHPATSAEEGQAVKFLARFLTDRSGASAAEYAMILAIVGTAIVFATISLGDAIGRAMNGAASCLSTASAGTPVC